MADFNKYSVVSGHGSDDDEYSQPGELGHSPEEERESFEEQREGYQTKEFRTNVVETATIGGFFLTPILEGALGIAKIGLAALGLVPIFMLAGWRKAWLAWKEYQLKKNNTTQLNNELATIQDVAYELSVARRKLAVEVAMAALVTFISVPFFLATLVGVGIAMTATTAAIMVAVPWVLFGGLIAKALYHFKAAWDDWQKTKSSSHSNHIGATQQEMYLGRAKGNVVGGVSLLLVAGAVLATMILGGPFGLAALGIAGAVVGLGYLAYTAYKDFKKRKAMQRPAYQQVQDGKDDSLSGKPGPANTQTQANILQQSSTSPRDRRKKPVSSVGGRVTIYDGNGSDDKLHLVTSGPVDAAFQNAGVARNASQTTPNTRQGNSQHPQNPQVLGATFIIGAGSDHPEFDGAWTKEDSTKNITPTLTQGSDHQKAAKLVNQLNAQSKAESKEADQQALLSARRRAQTPPPGGSQSTTSRHSKRVIKARQSTLNVVDVTGDVIPSTLGTNSVFYRRDQQGNNVVRTPSYHSDLEDGQPTLHKTRRLSAPDSSL